MLGGAGNVVANLLGLECHVGVISITGADETAQTIAGMLNEAGAKIDVTLVADKNRPTSLKTRFMAGHQQLLRVANTAAAARTKAIYQSRMVKEPDRSLTCSQRLKDNNKSVLIPLCIR